METDLKLAFRPGGLGKIERHGALRPVKAVTRLETTTYFDTADHALFRAGVSVAIRRYGRTLTQRIEICPGHRTAGAAVLRHRIWDWPTKSEEPDLGLIAGTPLAAIMPTLGAARLRRMFAVEIRKSVRVIRPDAETALELAFERGWLRAGENAEPVREIAIHLKRGSTETMYRVALELHALTPLVVSLESNVGRGYRLITGAAPAPQKATRLELAADIDLQSGLQEIFGNALRHLLANQAATLAGDVEGLHQMRVALRRIRAGLALFAPALEPYAARRFTLECRRLGRVFGQARDLDVFALETLDAAEQAGLKVERLRPLARTRREGADGQVEATIADPAFTGFFLALSAWISGSAWAAPGADAPAMRHRPLARVAPDLLDRLARKCATLGGGHLAGQSPEALHDLRKRLKILRYCVEFTGSLYDGIAVKRYRQACGHLQEQLGAINDMQATIELVAGLARSNGIDLVPEAGALAQWCENQAGACRLGLRAAWRGFEKADPFWR